MRRSGTILNGPYLLAPTTNHITVAWETDLPIDSIIWYGTKGQLDNSLVVKCERGTPWKDNPEGLCMYRAVLTNLKAGMMYAYKVALESGEIKEGCFKTLRDNPGEIRIFTLSDSHLFRISQEFTDVVLQNRPDFIIHSGDISLATGYQKDEYSTNWFHKAHFLNEIPAIYAFGNHDISPYYDDFFMGVQQKVYHTDKTGHNISFTYGNTHIVFLDSNPWGLFEMNAVNSGLPVDEGTSSKIDITLKWLTDDLKSSEAQEAMWRILVLHHPYTDDFTNKHIVTIAENYNVNLVISGHLHYYIKNVSVNPKIGAKTVYISQGSAQDYGVGLDSGNADERILSNFPEVIATGQANYGCITITKDALSFKSYGFQEDLVDSKLVDEVILAAEESQIVVSQIVISADDTKGIVTIEGYAKNEGRGLAVVALAILDNGKEIMRNLFGVKGKERVVALNPGEARKIHTEYTIMEPGRHIITVNNTTQLIDIVPSSSIVFENLRSMTGQGKASNIIFTTVEIMNNQDCSTIMDIDLYIDDRIVLTQKAELQSCEKKNVDFTYRAVKGGNYKVAVGGLETKITVEGTLKGIPIIKDLSGKGNHAFLRGTPRLIADSDRSALCLDKDGDYIEIPDSETLHVKDGYTGIVWANLNRLAAEDEMGHNPLMVKGISTGWGATYLLRMCVERNGKIKWGTCYGITEYSWQGGKASVGDWVQYSSTFDKKTGGASYCNKEKVAETIGIPMGEPLRNWEGLPLFVGYSYIGHIIKEIGRPKYFTHLSAKISQIRFYKTKLSESEIKDIYDHPNQVGSNGNDLAVWLNFRDIETRGIHKTEWRRPVMFYPSYKTEKQLWGFKTLSIDATIPEKTCLKVVIQVSDDEESVKDSIETELMNGKQTIDISVLLKAQFIRIVTEFNSSVTPEGTYTPELHEYKIGALLGQVISCITWGTRADWENGDSNGAVGFEPLNRTKVFDEYTDVIHG
ncbi:purple acid phosphatase family protein [Pelosinus propionicus]|uniref:Concanavalin A-like lectin/glucanases superfamily protein n=1 Tax=Pelosinus propionicus DSM 13327 TaxID=1123291 RepID=A0A1I4L6A1_9FIRM|nr:metallophosphoesterase family protein [Pelosinus propionicus]SFL86399.1 Concanavalin A-like lectin/glucanases superfamily protein [Pelosinus propionicus DSM 13327]